MTTQKRWRCTRCKREFIYNHQVEGRCPGCQSDDTEQVTFQGRFDIDTPRQLTALVTGDERAVPRRAAPARGVESPPMTLGVGASA